MSVNEIKKLLEQNNPKNLPLINSYIAGNRQEIYMIEGIEKALSKYEDSHYVR